MTLFAPAADRAEGAGADGSLVIAALDVLKREYPKPVNTVALLNAAIVALRKATNLDPDKLPDLSAGLDDSRVVAAFRQEFADAVRARTVQEAQLAYAATRGMPNSLNDSQVFSQDPSQREEGQRKASGKPDFEGIGVTITSRKDASGTAWIFVEDVYSDIDGVILFSLRQVGAVIRAVWFWIHGLHPLHRPRPKVNLWRPAQHALQSQSLTSSDSLFDCPASQGESFP